MVFGILIQATAAEPAEQQLLVDKARMRVFHWRALSATPDQRLCVKAWLRLQLGSKK